MASSYTVGIYGMLAYCRIGKCIGGSAFVYVGQSYIVNFHSGTIDCAIVETPTSYVAVGPAGMC